ncbi:unnamed protein product [Brassica rapa]|uniref:Uncharacterized protein n=1 Tax=Brassica campestris TaxID=3711 RepID=A0A3P5ZN23_BRACM|nr:unnamed protein product [Brassica rapa]VDC73940.1 unnamed protein product [Brassica rapa]
MKKQSSSRSQRGSRGLKGKHVVQICVLLGVCIWLIYQVKYSHDKKKELYEGDVKKSTVLLENEEGMVKLGRKDLLPGYHKQNEKEKHVVEEEDDEEEEKESKSRVENSSTHEEEEKEDEEDEEEEDKNKLGEEVVEEDEEENKHEEDDDIDEQDQSKDDELLQEEKEKEAETNHADEIVHEAREEHYKADDASSAVSHESRILNTEKLNESYGNSTGPSQENSSNTTTNEVEVQKEPVLKLGEAESKDSAEITVNAVTELRGETVNGNSTEAVLEASGFVQNETRTMQERSQEHDKTEDGAPPSGSSDLQNVVELEQTRNETDANITVSENITNKDSIQDEFRNSTSKSSLVENISGSNTTEVMKESSRSEGDDETEEKESSDHFGTEQTEEADDTPESTMLQEEREALTDPQTLPDISIEGKKEEDEEEAMAAE